ncbi:DUF551 domain-containing protein [uncultured Eubacterium sp.]|uniref:DUF551 domain-containing protein n=1 Tax=uncultured Eubacterium sp. TaxID=165185 RepID=UPI0026712614|nr:DUF551 domain-containing protein [uncultured Eubacterium sp.]
MQKVFEKIKENIKALDKYHDGIISVYEAIKIVNKVAEEHNNGWIPVDERMPPEEDSMFAKYKGTDKWSNGMFEKTSKTVQVIISDPKGKCVTHVAHTLDGKWSCDLLKINSNYKITHWQPLQESCY